MSERERKREKESEHIKGQIRRQGEDGSQNYSSEKEERCLSVLEVR